MPDLLAHFGSWYHGTGYELNPGDRLTHEKADELGRVYDARDKGHLFFTDSHASAQAFAIGAADMHNQLWPHDRQVPRVYEVEPEGEHDEDPNLPGMGGRRTRHPLRVVREALLEHFGANPPCHWCGEPLDDEDVDNEVSSHEECHDMRQCPVHGEHEDPALAEGHRDTYTDWSWHLPFRQGIHRGLVKELPGDVHRMVHDESWPAADRARVLRGYLHREGFHGGTQEEQPYGTDHEGHLGVHWTPSETAARAWGSDDTYEGPVGMGPKPSVTHIVLHAQSPHEHEIETDPDHLEARHMYGYDHERSEREVPLKYGAPVRLTGISWKHGGQEHWHRHDFAPHGQHMAAAGDSAAAVVSEQPRLGVARQGSAWIGGAWQGRQVAGALDVPALANPYHGNPEFGGRPEFSHTWFHGTRGTDPEFHEQYREGTHEPRMTQAPDERAMNSGWPQPNKLLGVHLSPLYRVAHRFARGVYPSKPDPERGYAGKPGIPSAVVHARLHMQNPAHYPTEQHLNLAVADWASKGYPHWHNDKLNASMQWNYSDTEGTHRDFSMRHPYDPNADYAGNRPFRQHAGKAQQILQWHPHLPEIVEGFRRNLESQGHHGITYGNEVEGPGQGGHDGEWDKEFGDHTSQDVRHISAIATRPSQIETARVEHIAPPQTEPEAHETEHHPLDRPRDDGWEHGRNGYASDSCEPKEMYDRVGRFHAGHGGEYPREHHQAAKTAAAEPQLQVSDYEGRTGDPSHITRSETGLMPVSAVTGLAGVRGERPGEHRNRQGADWESFKDDIARNGIRNPIFITVDHGEEPKISEGNHRRDAAAELGHSHVPVEIRYFGHAERQGTVYDRSRGKTASTAGPAPDPRDFAEDMHTSYIGEHYWDPSIPKEEFRAAERPYLDHLKGQIDRQGMQNPIEIKHHPESGRTYIDDGLHRLLAAEELGHESVPVYFSTPDGPVRPSTYRTWEMMAKNRGLRTASSDGDKLYECAKGHEHWGRYGAAGLLIRHRGEDGQQRYLLQKRAPYVNEPDTWCIPGGAIGEHESPEQGAWREAREEMGSIPRHVKTHHTVTSTDCGDWQYHTVVADAGEHFMPGGRGETQHETAGVGWHTAAEIEELRKSGDLHPGFDASWDAVRRSRGPKTAVITPGSLPPEQQAGMDAEDHREHRRRMLDVAKNPPPGTRVWRGEIRRSDEDPGSVSSVGMHWSVNPDSIISGWAPEGHKHVVWQGVVENHAEQAFPRGHPIWSGRHESFDHEAEVRFRPGASVKLEGAYVHEPEEYPGGLATTPGHLVPRFPERTHPGWEWHPLDHHAEVRHRGQGAADYSDVGIEREAVWDTSGSDKTGIYVRFGHWPKNERSFSPAGGYYEDGVSAYDADKHGNPAIDHGLDRGHVHDDDCEPDCDLDTEGPDNDPRQEMAGRLAKAERNRYYGSDKPSETAHLVRGEMAAIGYDGEPLLRNVRRVGDWIDHRHLFFPGAERHKLARDPHDEDYEPPRKRPAMGYAVTHGKT